MKKILVLVLAAAVSLSGCAGSKSQRLRNDYDSLSARVDALEKKQEYTSTSTEVVDVNYTSKGTTSLNEKVVSMSSRDVQSALKEAGYYNGPIDGKIGPKSRSAIKEFQADNGLKVDGIVGTNTKKALVKFLVN